MKSNILNEIDRLQNSIINIIPMGIVIIEKTQGKIIYVNKRAKELYGVDPCGLEMSDHSTKMMKLLTLNSQVYPPEQLPTSSTLITGKEVNEELIIERPDDSQIIVHASASPITDKNGQIIGALGIFHDITEKKKTENDMRCLNERFQMAQHAAGVGVWDWNINTGKIDWSDEMFLLFGLDPQKNTSSFETWTSLLHPEERVIASERIDEALKNHSFLNNEYRIVRPNGEIVWINALGKAEYDKQNNPVRMMGVCIDVTEHRKIEEQLREQNLVISSTTDTIFSTDELFMIKIWNRAAEQTFGWNAEEVIGKATSEVLNPIYSTFNGATREKILEKLMSNGSWHGELICHKKDGSSIPVLASSSLVKNNDGKITGSVAILHDITPRKKREETLREAQHDLNHAQAVGKIGSWRLNTRRNVLLWSDENHKIFGIPKGTKLTYQIFLNTVYPDDRDYVDEKWNLALQGEPYDIEHRIIVDGKVKWVREKADLEFNEKGDVKGAFGTTQDITDFVEIREQLRFYTTHLEQIIKEKSKQLRDAERMAAIGQTAGMIGHDIRNPLQSIDGAIYLAKESVTSLPDGSAQKKELEELHKVILEQIGYIDHVVADLQDFSKFVEPKFAEIDLPEVITESFGIVEVPENIVVTVVFPDEPLKLVADPYHLKRIISNLIKNAVQAMPDGGEVTIIAYRRNDYVFLRIEDTGVGIPEHIKPNIFTPLFTTKSKGQGFGLAVCKKLVEAQNGDITFHSEEGKGTTFTIKIPTKHENDN